MRSWLVVIVLSLSLAFTVVLGAGVVRAEARQRAWGRLLAADRRRDRGRTEAFRPLPAETGSDAHCTFIRETGHRLCFGFRAYWQSHGLEFGDPG
ncbi:hypothetical protein NET02_04285 [Thermomicrobiaceae bacterium CFH 74404]|uniref:Uncharacterized protein n=1 Tax=Thermalbibacter longus TaxID=2951981 RepID=A0AA41W9M5_9BACT|nr:hypothetical protein [Thermalbibacter longus]MCM8748354.1 hypothetical protein [Thermalbibacter longus]